MYNTINSLDGQMKKHEGKFHFNRCRSFSVDVSPWLVEIEESNAGQHISFVSRAEKTLVNFWRFFFRFHILFYSLKWWEKMNRAHLFYTFRAQVEILII